MKTAIAAASFTLIAALSGLSGAHAAGFNDRSALPGVAASVQAGRQDLSHVTAVRGFNRQSHIAVTALQSTAGADRAPMVAGVHCDLAPRAGFQDSTSFARC